MVRKVQKALVTDLGGVLLRTEDKIPRTRLAERFGLTYAQLDDLVFNSQTGKLAEAGLLTDSEHHQYLIQRLNIQPSDLPAFFDQFFQGDRFDKDLLSFMGSYRKDTLLVLLSNAWRSAAAALRQRYEIERYFDRLFFSAEVKLTKPDHRIYRLVEEEINIGAPNIVYVDDNLENIEAAKELGWHTIHFLNADQTKQEILYALGDPAADEE